MNLHKGQHIIDDILMEYRYIVVEGKSKVRVLMNGINTKALNICKAAIQDIPDMQGDFDITARYFIEFISMTPSLEE